MNKYISQILVKEEEQLPFQLFKQLRWQKNDTIVCAII